MGQIFSNSFPQFFIRDRPWALFRKNAVNHRINQKVVNYFTTNCRSQLPNRLSRNHQNDRCFFKKIDYQSELFTYPKVSPINHSTPVFKVTISREMTNQKPQDVESSVLLRKDVLRFSTLYRTSVLCAGPVAGGNSLNKVTGPPSLRHFYQISGGFKDYQRGPKGFEKVLKRQLRLQKTRKGTCRVPVAKSATNL